MQIRRSRPCQRTPSLECRHFFCIELCSEPYHSPMEAGEIGFFQENVGRIAKGEATVDAELSYFRQFADEN